MPFSNRIAALVAPVLLAGLGACGGQEVKTSCDPSGDPSCFSPCQNVGSAFEQGAVGCSCAPGSDRDWCLADSTGRKILLTCGSSGAWQAQLDSSCTPE
jgi:hypothetical protein